MGHPPDKTETLQSLVIISGMSGSGKHTVFQALEDLGYYCVDNIPAALIPQLVQVTAASGGKIRKMAVVVDIRLEQSIAGFRQLHSQLQLFPFQSTVVFVDASDEVLARRYSETRRMHPLAHNQTLLEAVRSEREVLSEVRSLANLIIDTSGFSVHDLRRLIYQQFEEGGGEQTLRVALMSFGYKYGLPYNADLVFDVRFLPNPYFVPELKPLSGENAEIRSYLFGFPETAELLGHLEKLLEYLLPKYIREGKKYMTVAVGCTGGRHRSVVIASKLQLWLEGQDYSCQLVHRDIHKEA